MQTKDILDEWSKNKERLFMYQRYESDTPRPCEVVGFITEPAVTTGNRWDRKPARKWVEVRMFHPHDWSPPTQDENGAWVKPEGTITRVPARTLTASCHETWAGSAERWHKNRTERAERDAQRERFRDELAEISDALHLNLRPSTNLYGEVCVAGNLDDLFRLVATLRDAQRFYETLAQDEAV